MTRILDILDECEWVRFGNETHYVEMNDETGELTVRDMDANVVHKPLAWQAIAAAQVRERYATVARVWGYKADHLVESAFRPTGKLEDF